MGTTEIRLQVLPEFQLKLEFPNGSEAIVDMKRRTQGIRFGRLASPTLFATAQLVGDEVVWEESGLCIRASINELLDSMQME